MQNRSEQQRQALTALLNSAGNMTAPSTLLPASDYFDLAGEEFGRRLMLSEGADGTQYCLRPDFTLPIAKAYKTAKNITPQAFVYLGPVFRQRTSGPTEFEQAGLELLAQTDPNKALHQVFEFAKSALNIFDVTSPTIKIGSVALFEALLEQADLPKVWRPRLRRRFGNPEAMKTLLARLADPQAEKKPTAKPRQQLIAEITQNMREDGVSLISGRQPEDIADRVLEKQALAAAVVPAKTIKLFEQYLAISGPLEVALPAIESILEKAGISLQAQINELKIHARELANQFPRSKLTCEATISPRLHYYTGLVFELLNSQNKVLASGGQYDRLLQALGASAEISASGCAIWVKRLQEESMQ